MFFLLSSGGSSFTFLYDDRSKKLARFTHNHLKYDVAFLDCWRQKWLVKLKIETWALMQFHFHLVGAEIQANMLNLAFFLLFTTVYTRVYR